MSENLKEDENGQEREWSGRENVWREKDGNNYCNNEVVLQLEWAGRTDSNGAAENIYSFTPHLGTPRYSIGKLALPLN